MSRLTRDGTTTEPFARDQILRRERRQGNINLPCSADHEQDWQPYPVDPYYYYMFDHTYIIHIFLWYILPVYYNNIEDIIPPAFLLALLFLLFCSTEHDWLFWIPIQLLITFNDSSSSIAPRQTFQLRHHVRHGAERDDVCS